MDQLNATAIVILNYNGRDFLRQFLPAVLRYRDGAAVIVADNRSTDDSVAVVREEFPEVLLILMSENRGFCGGYNTALLETEGKYSNYILLNSDVEVTAGWVRPLIRLLDERSDIAAVQPKVLSWHQRDFFEYAGAAGGYIDALGYPFCRGRLFDTLEKDTGQYNDDRPVFWATGACLAIKASIFHRMGGFDEDFFAHMEEIDLCWKIHRTGLQVYAAGGSTVYHIGGGTLSRLNSRKTYYNFRNGLTLIFKNMSAGELVWKLPVRILLDWAAAGSFVVRGSFANAGAVLKAHVHFMGALPGSVRKRKKFRHLSVKRITPATVYPGSVLAAYFLKGQKVFSALKF